MTRPTNLGYQIPLLSQRIGSELPNPITDPEDAVDRALDASTWVPTDEGAPLISFGTSILDGTGADATEVYDGDLDTFRGMTNSGLCFVTVDFGTPVTVNGFSAWARGNQFDGQTMDLAVYGKATAFTSSSDTGDETLYSASVTLPDDTDPPDEFAATWPDAEYRYWRVKFFPDGQGIHFFELSLTGHTGFELNGCEWIVGGEAAVDGDDATYAETDGPCALLLDIEDAQVIVSARLRIACETSGARTYNLIGANEADFSDATTLDSVSFTATGSFTAQDVSFSWGDAGEFRYFLLEGNDETRRIHSLELYEATTATAAAAAVAEHVADTTDAHDASAVSYSPTGTIAATDVQAAVAEVATDASAALADHSTQHEPGGSDELAGYVLKTLGGKETVNTVASSGSTLTLNLTAGNVHDVTLTANCTLSLAGATPGVSCVMEIWLRQDGTGGRTVTWPGSVTWQGGSAPVLQTAINALDIIVLQTLDGGTTWLGVAGDSSVNSHIADTTDAHDASAISIADSGGYFAGSTVEDALQEIGAGGIGGGGEDTSLFEVAAAGASETLDCSIARLYHVTLDDDCTIALTGASDDEAHRLDVLIRQDGTGGWTVTWPAEVYWPGGIAPTLATDPYHTDWVELATIDGGTVWHGVLKAADLDTPTPPAPGGGSYWPLLWLSSGT